MKIEVFVETLFPSGALLCSCIVGGAYYKRSYYGYSKRAAVAEFRAYVKRELGQ